MTAAMFKNAFRVSTIKPEPGPGLICPIPPSVIARKSGAVMPLLKSARPTAASTPIMRPASSPTSERSSAASRSVILFSIGLRIPDGEGAGPTSQGVVPGFAPLPERSVA